MERTWTARDAVYRRKVVYTGYFMVFIFFFATVALLLIGGIIPLLGMGLSAYGIYATYVRKSYPRVITIDGESIAFTSYGTKTYTLDRLEMFCVRSDMGGYQLFVRIGEHDGAKGRFWVTPSFFEDSDELFDEFIALERRVHPDSIIVKRSRPAK